MSNSTQNDHETHTACIERIRKEGASSTCCYCDPHEGCTLGMRPSTQNDWAKTRERVINILGYDHMLHNENCHLCNVAVDDIVKLLADARKESTRHIKEAWLNEGVCPAFHHRAQEKLSREWPTLYKAILATLKEEKI